MDLMSIVQRDNKVSLLTLPHSDLKVSSGTAAAAAAAAAANNDNAASKENKTPKAAALPPKQLVLMQLPKGLTMSDLASSPGCCHLMAPRTTTTSSTTKNNSDYDASDRQASLVLESKQESYSISRLETSNVLVLVPPIIMNNEDTSASSTTSSSTMIAMDNENNANSDAGPNKRPKIVQNTANSSDANNNNTNTLLPVPARLLQMGGSGASFLELKRKHLRPGELLALLQQHVFDPYNNSNRVNPQNPYSKSTTTNNNTTKTLGRTITSLALELQCSQGQVEAALPLVQGFSIPSSSESDSSPTRYGLLSEEALQEAQKGIIATLAEEFELFGDYAGQGVKLQDLIPQVVSRFPTKHSYDELERVIRFALTTLTTTASDKNAAESGTVQVDVTKIAVCLAHRLFQTQTAPWEEKRLCLRWQSELPGVGTAYQISLDMLRGVAIPLDASTRTTPLKKSLPTTTSSSSGTTAESSSSSSGNIVWKYFPANKLPLQPELRFPALFNFKDQWTLKELEPYLEGLVLETNLTQAELLLQYTSNSPGVDGDGNAVKIYSFKRS